MKLSLLLCSALVSLVTSQFVSPKSKFAKAKGFADIHVRYKDVRTGPGGICETTPGKKSYSGFVDVAEDQHIFFWFFEAREVNPDEAPLTLWINGGPGSSSMIGLFQELGPCGVDPNGKVYHNPHAWNRKTNLLVVDQPVGVGLSYSVPKPGYIDTNTNTFVTLPNSTCPDYLGPISCGTFSELDPTLTANSTQAAAPNVWKTLQGFMGAFPQYARGGFHFTTESYGGHWGPVFNEYFEEQNAKNIPGASKISLKTVAIGNGWYDPIINYAAYYNFTVSPGNTYDVRFNKTVEQQLYNAMYGQGNCHDQLTRCRDTGRNDVCSLADTFCANMVENLFDTALKRDEYDIRELTPDQFPYENYVDYLNQPHVQQELGLFTNFTSGSSLVSSSFSSTGDDAREDNTIEDLGKLLEQGVDVMMYYGDADYNCNWIGGTAIAAKLNAAGYATAGFTDMQTSDKITHGQVRQAGHYSFVRIYEAGHEVPFYQPLASLEMFERQLDGLDIATGKVKVTPAYKTKGPLKSTYREGNGTVQFSVVPEGSTYNTTTNGPNRQKGKSRPPSFLKRRKVAKLESEA